MLHTALVTAALVRCAGWRDELHLQNKCFDKDININVWSRSEHAAVVIYIFRVVLSYSRAMCHMSALDSASRRHSGTGDSGGRIMVQQRLVAVSS